jgi:hypothetical protein
MSSESNGGQPDGLVGRPEEPQVAVFAVCSLKITGDTCVTLWHGVDCEAGTTPECKLRLSPDRPAIIGRAEGHQVHYLDPAFRPTRLVPGSGQNIMQAEGHGSNMYVSRGHFMLRTAGRGVMLVNGVPRPGGGLRAPRNGTRMVVPERRHMTDGEEYLIDSGATAVIILPNGAEVQIRAE